MTFKPKLINLFGTEAFIKRKSITDYKKTRITEGGDYYESYRKMTYSLVMEDTPYFFNSLKELFKGIKFYSDLFENETDCSEKDSAPKGTYQQSFQF